MHMVDSTHTKVNNNDVDPPNKTRSTYDSAADHFDDSVLSFWDTYGRRTVQRLSLDSGSVVHDVGCGSGASAIPSAEIVGRSGKVIGIHLSERLLFLAQNKALRRDLQNIELLLGDMTDLHFPEESFDSIISVFSIFFVADM